jgi:hypothetical protein
MTDELHARVDTAWSRAWIGFTAITALGLGLVAWRLLGAERLPAPDSPRPLDGATALRPLDGSGADDVDAAEGACETLAECRERCVLPPLVPPPEPVPAHEEEEREPEPGIDIWSCLDLAEMLRAGAEGKAPDHRAAGDVYRRVCFATGHARACSRAALIDGLLVDLSAAPAWIDQGHTPRDALSNACEGEKGEGDPLGCAGYELLADQPRDAPHLPEMVRIAMRACDAGLPEACYLAAVPMASTAATAAEAMTALRGFCDRGDLPSCFYQWRRGAGDVAHEDALLRACTDVPGPRLAAACKARAIASPRKRELQQWACAAGDCAGVDDKAVLTAACSAGQVNGCAEALVVLRAGGMTSAAWKETRARAAKLAPAVEAQLKSYDDLPAAAAGYIDACLFGSARGCQRTVQVLPPDLAATAELRNHAAILSDPLVKP